MKRVVLILATVLLGVAAGAQTRWIDPLKEGAEVHGQGWAELNGTYRRLPDKAKDSVRERVWDLSLQPSGLSIVFRSNATSLTVRYRTTGPRNMWHMSTSAMSGVDLFVRDSEDREHHYAPDFTPYFGETITYRYSKLDYAEGETSREYHLYLPLFNELEQLELGIPEDADLTFVPRSGKKAIVIYGTSIVHGGCASRPGNTWPTIIEREFRHPVVNLGFSGQGKMEPEIIKLMAGLNADLYILDCIPNMIDGDPVGQRLRDAVKILREAGDCPILITEHAGAGCAEVVGRQNEFETFNIEQKETYDALVAEGWKNLYYLSCDELGIGEDCKVDGIHPNDLGMRRYADAYEAIITEIFYKQLLERL